MKYKKPNNILLKGFPGSGKTVTVNFVLKEIDEIKDNLDSIIINCNDKTSLDVIKSLIVQTRKDNLVRGNFNELIKIFLEGIQKDILIVLDEVDRSNKMEKLLYYLSRPSEIFPDFKKNISVVLISNNLGWEENLRDSIRSSLQLKKITFNPYSENEIKKILNVRIKKGLFDSEAIEKSLIDLIAKTCVKKRRGDCRVAIESVFYSAQIAESNDRNYVLREDVKKALGFAIDKSDKVLVEKLRDNQLMILYLLCSSKFNNLEELHFHYIDIIKKEKLKIDSITKVMVFHIINYLDNLCLIDKKVTVSMDKNNIPRRNIDITCKVNAGIVIDELSIRGLRLANEYVPQNSKVDSSNTEDK
jgi:Cdc6-like AAA superfamily ATPase